MLSKVIKSTKSPLELYFLWKMVEGSRDSSQLTQGHIGIRMTLTDRNGDRVRRKKELA